MRHSWGPQMAAQMAGPMAGPMAGWPTTSSPNGSFVPEPVVDDDTLEMEETRRRRRRRRRGLESDEDSEDDFVDNSGWAQRDQRAMQPPMAQQPMQFMPPARPGMTGVPMGYAPRMYMGL
mmetsp:Transcript_89687/g.205019  ORF Transcript_89687/g.205019 Transcript_89687/m.205019 type:complete len:120 (-) Transcript_89687:85-444(-)